MTDDRCQLHLGDCLDVLRAMPDASVDAVVTDPPYGLAFMGKKWDHSVPGINIWAECLRVLKPGGHLLAFFGTRTYHRGVVNIEDAGFEIRDCIAWVYGSGFPKSLDVSKAIDKAAGAEGAYGGPKSAAHAGWIDRGKMRGDNGHEGFQRPWMDDKEAVNKAARQYLPATPEAQQWDGWGTALKPAIEPCVMARKPLDGTVAQNVLKHGTGGINVDGCRVGTSKNVPASISKKAPANCYGKYAESGETPGVGGHDPNLGRWPSNLIHDGSDEVVGLFPEVATGSIKPGQCKFGGMFGNDQPVLSSHTASSGSAARFFYTAKASASERQGVTHPTVKPIDLMAYLCRLVTPPGGIVLDPFMGSGTTIKAALSEGFRGIGIEREPAYYEMAEHRLTGAQMGLPLCTPQET